MKSSRSFKIQGLNFCSSVDSGADEPSVARLAKFLPVAFAAQFGLSDRALPLIAYQTRVDGHAGRHRLPPEVARWGPSRLLLLNLVAAALARHTALKSRRDVVISAALVLLPLAHLHEG